MSLIALALQSKAWPLVLLLPARRDEEPAAPAAAPPPVAPAQAPAHVDLPPPVVVTSRVTTTGFRFAGQTFVDKGAARAWIRSHYGTILARLDNEAADAAIAAGREPPADGATVRAIDTAIAAQLAQDAETPDRAVRFFTWTGGIDTRLLSSVIRLNSPSPTIRV